MVVIDDYGASVEVSGSIVKPGYVNVHLKHPNDLHDGTRPNAVLDKDQVKMLIAALLIEL